MVTETWVQEVHFDAKVKIDGYINHCHWIVTNGRKDNGGGVVTYTKYKLVEQMVSLEKHNKEAKWIKKKIQEQKY